MQKNKTAEMTRHIFAATERLMAEQGLHCLSMKKIAKEANISAGTIYVYFKNKEELLNSLARHLFEIFLEALDKNTDLNGDTAPFIQYRQMWWNMWNMLLQNPNILLNIHQYKALPGFFEIAQEYTQSETNHWFAFCKRYKNDVLSDLPSDVLFSLSLESTINLASQAIHQNINYPTTLLENVIERTWCAIQK